MSPQVLSTAFLILCTLVLYQLALIFAPFFTPILWALILARLFYPLYQYLLRLLRGQVTLSALLSTLAVTFLAVLPVAYVAFLAITETIHAYQTAMTWLQNGGLKELPATLSGLPFIGNISQELLGRFVLAYGDLQGSLLEGGKAVSAVLLTGVSGLAKNTFDLSRISSLCCSRSSFSFETVSASTMSFTMRFPSRRVIKQSFSTA